MSAIYRPEAPLQIESVTPRTITTQMGDRQVLLVAGTVVNRQGRASKLAFDVWNPDASLKPALQPGKFITFEGRVVSRLVGERYFNDLSAFNSSIVAIDGYTPPAVAMASAATASATPDW